MCFGLTKVFRGTLVIPKTSKAFADQGIRSISKFSERVHFFEKAQLSHEYSGQAKEEGQCCLHVSAHGSLRSLARQDGLTQTFWHVESGSSTKKGPIGLCTTYEPFPIQEALADAIRTSRGCTEMMDQLLSACNCGAKLIQVDQHPALSVSTPAIPLLLTDYRNCGQ